MNTGLRYWLIVSLALVLTAGPAFAAGTSMLHAAMTMHEHCPECPADAGNGGDDCGVASCPAAHQHCAGATVPLASCDEVGVSAFALAYAQIHVLPRDRLNSRLEFCIFRPPIG